MTGIYITIGAEEVPLVLKDGRWPIKKGAVKGDPVYFLIGHKIVAKGRIKSNRDYPGFWGKSRRIFRDVADVHTLEKPVPLTELAKRLPDWKWCRSMQPIQTSVPTEFEKNFLKIVGEEAESDGGYLANDAAVAAIEKSYAKSQGFQLDSKTRRALEDHAMRAANRHFSSLGYAVEDHSKNHPYDLLCTKKQQPLHVEVKGTQTKGDGIVLTSGEVDYARTHKPAMALFVLHSIRISATGKLSGGENRVVVPWDVDLGSLKPISFIYGLPS